MGIRAGCTEITPLIYEQVRIGEEPDLGEGKYHSIDKDWSDFHAMFTRRQPPLSLAIPGDCLHQQSPHTLDEFCNEDHEYYVGFMSPGLVQELAEVISRLTELQLQQWFDELGGKPYDCRTDRLKAAYVEAARRGNALMIVIA
jgi:hypothetical protein